MGEGYKRSQHQSRVDDLSKAAKDSEHKQNYKFEARNPKQIQMTKIPDKLISDFEICKFGFESFGLFRISTLDFGLCFSNEYRAAQQ